MKSYLIPLTIASALLCQLPTANALDPNTAIPIGHPAPDIQGKDLENRPMKLSEFRGKVVVLSFWNGTSPACKTVIPQQQALLKRLEMKPFVLLGVNGDKDVKEARRSARKEGVTWRSWFDGPGSHGPIAQSWGANQFPCTYVLDGKGVVRAREAYGKSLDQTVDKLLAELAKTGLR